MTPGKVAAVVLCACPAVLPQLVVPQGETSQCTVHSTAEHKSSDTSYNRFPSQHSCSSLPMASRDPLLHLWLFWWCCALRSSCGTRISSQGIKFSNKVDKHFPFSNRPNIESIGPCLPCCIQWHNTCSMSSAALYSLFNVSWLSPAHAGSFQDWTKYCTTCWNYSQLLGFWSGNYRMRSTFLSKSQNKWADCVLPIAYHVLDTCLGALLVWLWKQRWKKKTLEKGKVTAFLTERYKKPSSTSVKTWIYWENMKKTVRAFLCGCHQKGIQ